LFIPSITQLVHVFENHEHTTCVSKEATHIHAKEIDCDLFHRPYQNLALDIPSRFDVIPAHFYATTFNELPQVFHAVYHSKKSSRGPPCFIV
jgi:hypothetical protein